MKRGGFVEAKRPFFIIGSSLVSLKGSDWRKSDAENFAEAEARITSGSVALYYLFTSSLDTMHRYGHQNTNTEKAFSKFGHNLSDLMKKSRSCL